MAQNRPFHAYLQGHTQGLCVKEVVKIPTMGKNKCKRKKNKTTMKVIKNVKCMLTTHGREVNAQPLCNTWSVGKNQDR